MDGPNDAMPAAWADLLDKKLLGSVVQVIDNAAFDMLSRTSRATSAGAREALHEDYETRRRMTEAAIRGAHKSAREDGLDNDDWLLVTWLKDVKQPTATLTVEPPKDMREQERGMPWSAMLEALTAALPRCVLVKELDLRPLCKHMHETDAEYLHVQYEGGPLEKLHRCISRRLPPSHCLTAVHVDDDGGWNAIFRGDRDNCYFDEHVKAALQHHRIRTQRDADWRGMFENPGMRSSGGCIGLGQLDVPEMAIQELTRLLPQCPRLESVLLYPSQDRRFVCPITDHELPEEMSFFGQIGGSDGVFCGSAGDFQALAKAVAALPPSYPLKRIDLEAPLLHFSQRGKHDDDEDDAFAWPDLLLKAQQMQRYQEAKAPAGIAAGAMDVEEKVEELSFDVEETRGQVESLAAAMRDKLAHEQSRLRVYEAVAARERESFVTTDGVGTAGGDDDDDADSDADVAKFLATSGAIASPLPPAWVEAVAKAKAQMPPLPVLAVVREGWKKHKEERSSSADLAAGIIAHLIARLLRPVGAAVNSGGGASGKGPPGADAAGPEDGELAAVKAALSTCMGGGGSELHRFVLRDAEKPFTGDDAHVGAVLAFIAATSPGAASPPSPSPSPPAVASAAARFVFVAFKALAFELSDIWLEALTMNGTSAQSVLNSGIWCQGSAWASTNMWRNSADDSDGLLPPALVAALPNGDGAPPVAALVLQAAVMDEDFCAILFGPTVQVSDARLLHAALREGMREQPEQGAVAFLRKALGYLVGAANSSDASASASAAAARRRHALGLAKFVGEPIFTTRTRGVGSSSYQFETLAVARRLDVLLLAADMTADSSLGSGALRVDAEARRDVAKNLVLALAEIAAEADSAFETIGRRFECLAHACQAASLTQTAEEASVVSTYSTPGSRGLGAARAQVMLAEARLARLLAAQHRGAGHDSGRHIINNGATKRKAEDAAAGAAAGFGGGVGGGGDAGAGAEEQAAGQEEPALKRAKLQS